MGLIGTIDAKRLDESCRIDAVGYSWLNYLYCVYHRVLIGYPTCLVLWRLVEWRLTTRVFDHIATGRVDIVAFGAGMSAKRAEASCSSPAVSKNQKKNPGNSRGKDFAGFGNGQRHLTE